MTIDYGIKLTFQIQSRTVFNVVVQKINRYLK